MERDMERGVVGIAEDELPDDYEIVRQFLYENMSTVIVDENVRSWWTPREILESLYWEDEEEAMVEILEHLEGLGILVSRMNKHFGEREWTNCE